MGRISAPKAAFVSLRGRRFSWFDRWQAPLPLVGLDVGALDLFWVELSADAGQVRVVNALSEPLPMGWGQPDDVCSWDLEVLGQALSRLRARSMAPRYLAMGLGDADVLIQALDAGLLRGASDARAWSQELCWDVAPGPGGEQRISTSRTVVLTLQALAESVGLELAVLETREAAQRRGLDWLEQQADVDGQMASSHLSGKNGIQHHATAIGLALRRFQPWGTAC